MDQVEIDGSGRNRWIREKSMDQRAIEGVIDGILAIDQRALQEAMDQDAIVSKRWIREQSTVIWVLQALDEIAIEGAMEMNQG